MNEGKKRVCVASCVSSVLKMKILQHYGEADKILPLSSQNRTYSLQDSNNMYKVSAKYLLPQPQPLSKQLYHLKKYDVRKKVIFSRIYVYIPL